jgi:DNA-binding winged helix-turn-helix (wHTH) protein
MDRNDWNYRFGSAEFDTARFELKVAGLPVEVERRALEVLAYLLRHAGELATKEELLREVWAGRPTVDKVLPNAINKLRRALGEANAGLIVTQARLGYRLDGPVVRTAVGRVAISAHELSDGQAVPGRANFILRRTLGRTLGSEVWLAEHAKTHEQRVYKFARDGERLRSLKREVTLLRVLLESVEDTSHFVSIIDWNFEHSPYYLECEYGGESLAAWAADHLGGLDTAQRLELFLQVADAVAAAHAVGVLHKDLKPANVLVEPRDGRPHVRLTDFGAGRLLEPERLEALGITRLGMTVEDDATGVSTSGTPLYIAPEVFAGQAPTVRSDVFALGILLYQVLASRMSSPMVSGWEDDVPDALLQEDLRRATDGDPDRRFASAAELARSLRGLQQRRDDAARRQAQDEQAQRTAQALARAQARRPYLLATILALAAGIAVAVVLQQDAVRARNAAQAELARANAVQRFLTEDLVGRSNPLVNARGGEATVKDVLLAARERVAERFVGQPASEAAVRASMAVLFNAIDLWPEAEEEARRVLELTGADAAQRADAIEARAMLARVLSRRGRLDEAGTEIAQLARELDGRDDPRARYLLASARSTWHISRGEFAAAVAELETALAAVAAHDPGNVALADSLRFDLIASHSRAGDDARALAEAEALIAEASAREGDAALVVALARLAMARAKGEDHAAAEALLLQAEPVLRERLGTTHSRYLQLKGELFSVAFRRGDWPKAVDRGREVFEGVRVKLGEQHVGTWFSLVNLGRVLNESGDARAAHAELERAHERLAMLAGDASPQTQEARFLLAEVELALGRPDAADVLLSKLDASVLESGRATGLWDAGIGALRGMLAAQRGERAKARALLEPALAAMASEEQLDPPSRLYTAAKQTLARLR